MSCHYYQWAGTCYHRVPITRKVRDFSVSAFRVCPALRACSLDDLPQNLRKVEGLPAFPLTEARRRSLEG